MKRNTNKKTYGPNEWIFKEAKRVNDKIKLNENMSLCFAYALKLNFRPF